LVEKVRPNDNGNIIGADLPSPGEDKNLHEIINMYGPCGEPHRNAVCMKESVQKGLQNNFVLQHKQMLMATHYIEGEELLMVDIKRKPTKLSFKTEGLYPTTLT